MAFQQKETHGQALTLRLLPAPVLRVGPPQALPLAPEGALCRALARGRGRKKGSRADRLRAATRVLTLLVSVSVVLLKARWPADCPLLAPARVVRPAAQAITEAVLKLNFLLPAPALTRRRK